VDEQLPPQPDRRLAQRLGRLEELMERLVEKIVPESVGDSDGFRTSPTASVDDDHQIDVLEGTMSENAPVMSLLGVGRERPLTSMPTPESDTSMSRAVPSKYEKTSRTLHALLPSQHDINIIVNASPGALFVLSLFHSAQDYVDGKMETLASFAVTPPVSSHPALLAKRLLQLTVCLQQLSPSFDEKQLWLRKSASETMADWVSATQTLVTSNDELVGSVEGLECLILQSFYQSNAGNLRKGWLSIRRALSLAQLMGVDHTRTRSSIRSCDSRSDPTKRASPTHIWYKINFCDRYLSLLLGLPVGTQDNSFADEEFLVNDTPMEKLEKVYTVISGRIIERNRAKPNDAYALTQSIDCEFEMAAKMMGQQWWSVPTLDQFGTPQQVMNQMMHMMLQIHHHSLLILLHLPYMLRDASESRYDYSKNSCMRSSREVLSRFIAFRSLNPTAFSCRHVDYSSLVAAMTLLLGYLGKSEHSDSPAAALQRQKDRALAESVRAKMSDIARLNHDKLSGEAAEIITQLLPIIDGKEPSCEAGDMETCQLHLTIPYLGTININPAFGKPAFPTEKPKPSDSGPAPSTAATPAFDSMANPSLFLSLDPTLHQAAEANLFLSMDGESGGLVQMDDGGHDIPAFPDFTAEAGDWALQGVDTTYWSLLNGGINYGS
jgi:hypothetical protein